MTDQERLISFGRHYGVPRETCDKLVKFETLVREENLQQNLVSRSTLEGFWERHVIDSAQLVTLAPPGADAWLDVGSGAGLPGIVLALLTQAEHVLVEPRRLRADFLKRAAMALNISDRLEVQQKKVEKVERAPVGIITARAFASLSRTLASTVHLADAATVWLLHKGRSAAAELAEAREQWSASFELAPSVTASDASIVVVRDLKARVRR